MNDSTKEIGRLALRVEGDNWVAYYAMRGTMEGALFLGAIQMRFVQDLNRKNLFMAMMQDAVGDIIEETTGERPSWPSGPKRAPENERSGSS